MAKLTLLMPACISTRGLLYRRGSPLQPSVRCLNSQEVSNALRPFYFLVHPDLFGKHPDAQKENDKNMKTLKNYVETLVSEKKRPNPKDVSFFIKPRTLEDKEKNYLKTIRIRLKDGSIRDTVLTILGQAGLPTGYVDKIPVKSTDTSTNQKILDDVMHDVYGDEEFYTREYGAGFSPTDIRQPFTAWLANNINKARTRFSECEPIRLETERLQGEICYNFQLKDILWECGWDTLNRRGSVDAFNYLASQHPNIQQSLVGRTLVFGQKSGISVNGEIILYSGEVRSNWLNIIKNAPSFDKLLEFLPLYERALSQSLLGIRIVQTNENITLVDDYRTRLRKVVTSISDYRRRNNFPKSWPSSLSEFELCVESDASSLMVSPEGVLTIPASTPGFLIIEFITNSMQEATTRLQDKVSLAKEEGRVVSLCMNELGLIQLDKDFSITSQQMIYCCNAMLGRVHLLRHLTHGSHIIVTRYYMVKSDGVICIPWDIKFTDSQGAKDRQHQGSRLAITH
eukprot:TRINITY_DN3337_c0_g1_i1.p1 TRINITY_DN3337_c0_g1~~TRINITY_DN3337_c0_g1_i1.p1  ORF type:complete len:512 (-),score=88.29 TRINITY_DN3337_c0_g1_i1:290-1825(-)